MKNNQTQTSIPVSALLSFWLPPTLVFIVGQFLLYIGAFELMYTDEIMHFVGGFVIALSIYRTIFFLEQQILVKDLVFIPAATMVIAIFWEFYEFFAVTGGLEIGDTLCDLAIGFFAAVLFSTGVLIFAKR